MGRVHWMAKDVRRGFRIEVFGSSGRMSFTTRPKEKMSAESVMEMAVLP